MVPTIYPLETLHNSLSLRQVNAFLTALCRSCSASHARSSSALFDSMMGTPAPGDPFLSQRILSASALPLRPRSDKPPWYSSGPSSTVSSAGPSSPASVENYARFSFAEKPSISPQRSEERLSGQAPAPGEAEASGLGQSEGEGEPPEPQVEVGEPGPGGEVGGPEAGLAGELAELGEEQAPELAPEQVEEGVVVWGEAEPAGEVLELAEAGQPAPEEPLASRDEESEGDSTGPGPPAEDTASQPPPQDVHN
ncbi:PREDICTED: inositol hexakisphosphate and diphosphoinositol-pentakisphosphate kinase 1 isoform X2 [Crocodylus porosus]|nr:PREDICTED: inositol hexakisphosphate and diphosphoinositol-pentakisphosphate kinase 1 isoform X2 [Crocodylus porosus]